MKYVYNQGVSVERSSSLPLAIVAVASAALVAMLAIFYNASAVSMSDTEEVVLEADVTRQTENTPPTNDWVVYTRAGTPNTAAAFVEGPETPPLGSGSLQLTTVSSSEKVFAFNYDHVGTKLSDIENLSYQTYRSAGSAQQVAALNVQVDFNGEAAGGFTTLVFEPVYNNTAQGAVVSGEWQTWDGSTGVWWSTQPINGQCAGATAACDKTWDAIVANNPDAIIVGGVGVNQGSGNPGLTTYVDAFTFDDVTYDFEPTVSLSSKEACKNGGWMTSNAPVYKNQGQCVSSFASNKNR